MHLQKFSTVARLLLLAIAGLATVSVLIASNHVPTPGRGRQQPPREGGGPRLQGVSISEVLLTPAAGGDQVIELTNFSDRRVRLNGWYLCIRPEYWEFPRGIDIEPGAVLVIHVNADGTDTDTDIYAFDLEITLNENNGEVALYDAKSFASSRNLKDFVQWGPRRGPTRLTVAIAADQWQAGDSVPIEGAQPGNSLSLIGPGEDAQSWRFGPASIGEPNQMGPPPPRRQQR